MANSNSSVRSPDDLARSDPQRAFAQAEALARAGRHAEAETFYRALVKHYPAQAVLLNSLALSLKAMGQMREAEAVLRKAISIAPREAGFHNNLGNLLRQNESYADAESEYRQALALDPANADAYYNLGVTLENLGRPADAAQTFRHAILQRPGYYQAHTRIGVLMRKSQPAEALAAFDEAIAINPNFFDAHYYRGDVLVTLHRFNEAAAAQRRAIELRPESYQANFALGNALTDLGGADDEALNSYYQATELNPEFEPAHYGYSHLAWTLGRKDHRRSYARARESIGVKPALAIAEARMLLPQGAKAEAEALLRAAHTTAPEHAGVAALLAHTLATEDRFDESHTLFERALALEPQSTAHRRAFASMLLRAGEPRDAIRLLEEARNLSPFDQLTLANLSLAYREAGDSAGYESLVDFAKHVRVYDLPAPSGFTDQTAFNTALAEDLHRLHTRRVEPFDQTLRGGTQTTGNLFFDPTSAIGNVRDAMCEAIADYINTVPLDPTHPLGARREADFAFSGAWSCKLASRGFHTNHVHDMGWISSAYYVHLPDAVSDASARQGWLKFGESNLGLGERDAPSRHVQPAVGRLVLFPSYYWHGTVPFASADERLTIAFDVVPASETPPDGQHGLY